MWRRRLRQDSVRDGISHPGITEFNEPGVFVTFEETERDLAENVSSLGFNLRELEAHEKLVVDHVRVERSEISETGEYDLEGLFIRIGYAIDSIKAKRVVLDTIESLFAGLPNESILRAELRRLFQWLKDRGVPRSSPASAEKESSPAMDSRNMSPIALFFSTTGSKTNSRRAECESSSTAGPLTAPTNILS